MEPKPSKAVDDRLTDELVSRAQAEALQLTGEGGVLVTGTWWGSRPRLFAPLHPLAYYVFVHEEDDLLGLGGGRAGAVIRHECSLRIEAAGTRPGDLRPSDRRLG